MKDLHKKKMNAYLFIKVPKSVLNISGLFSRGIESKSILKKYDNLNKIKKNKQIDSFYKIPML